MVLKSTMSYSLSSARSTSTLVRRSESSPPSRPVASSLLTYPRLNQDVECVPEFFPPPPASDTQLPATEVATTEDKSATTTTTEEDEDAVAGKASESIAVDEKGATEGEAIPEAMSVEEAKEHVSAKEGDEVA
jgi:hypothetical protein